MPSMEIYFNDLTEEAKQAYLKACGAKDESELNHEYQPITILDIEEQTNTEGNTMAEHTPGPWTEKDGQIYNDSGRTHCLIPYWDKSDQRQKADARLIAAAPDMLEALKAILGNSNIDKGTYWIIDIDDIRQAQQAIAKATS